MTFTIILVWALGAAILFATLWTQNHTADGSLFWRLALVACWPVFIVYFIFGLLFLVFLPAQQPDRRG